MIILQHSLVVLLTALVLAGTGAAAQDRSLPGLDPEILEDHYRLAEALRQNEFVPADVVSGIQLHAELVDAGHVPSIRRLAEGYLNGTGVAQDRERAIDLLRTSIARGDEKARTLLGRALITMGGREEEALEHLSEAVELGLDRAEFHLARAHVRGDFGEVSDPVLGIELLTSLSEAGDASAAYELATAYRQGGPAIADPERARQIFQAMVDAGDARASEELGEMYRDGDGGPVDPEHAIELFSWAFANGRPEAARKQSDLLASLGRFAEARSVAVARVAAGEPDAQIELALADLGGTFGPASQPEEAQSVLRQISADPDLPTALRMLEYLEERSLPVEIDISATMDVVRAAATEGDLMSAEAMIDLSRQRPELFENALETRSMLLAELGSENLGSGTYFEETVRMIGETSPGSSGGPDAVATLAAADGEGFRAGLLAAYEANRNLYVYLLQDVMRRQEIFDGSLDGVANASTVSAIMELCREGDIYGVCAVGPLGEEAAVALADLLAGQRSGDS